MSTLARFLPLAIATATAFAAGVGYDNTPQIPGQKWKVHDKTRPNPPIVEPGESFSHQAPAPADAVVVGSAIVRRMGECGAAPDFVDRIVSFVTPLTAAAHRARE